MSLTNMQNIFIFILIISSKKSEFQIFIGISALSVYHPSINVNTNSSLSFQIKIDTLMGLIFYAEDIKTNSFVSLKLLSSAKVRLDVGLFYHDSTRENISMSKEYPTAPDYLTCIIDLSKIDGLIHEWHTIMINFHKKSIILQFNQFSEKVNIPIGYNSFKRFDGFLGDTMFFGGLPEKLKQDASHRVFFSSAIEPSFSGRISAVRIVRFSRLYLIPVMIQFQSDAMNTCYFDSNFCRYCSSSKKCTKYEYLTFDHNSEIGYAFPVDVISEINRSINFQFKTKQDNSFLFYIGSLPGLAEQFQISKTQFISVYIEDGLFHIIISNPQSVDSSFYTRKFHCNSIYKTCADDKWHNVQIKEFRNDIVITLDDFQKEFKNLSNQQLTKTIHMKFAKATEPFQYYRQTQLPQYPPLSQFRGCMKEIYLHQNNVTLNIVEMVTKKVYNFHSNGKLNSDICMEMFPIKPVSFTGKSDYLQAFGIRSVRKAKFSLSFKTHKSDCLIAYQPSSKKGIHTDTDFYSIEIRDFALYFSIGLNSVVYSKVMSNYNVSNGLLHNIVLHFELPVIRILLDKENYVLNISTNYHDIEFEGSLYIGSLDDTKILSVSHHVWSGILGTYFSGCIFSLTIDDSPIQLDLLIKKNSSISSGCKTSEEMHSLNVCANQPCNEGICQIEWDQRSCDCTKTNFTGNTCNKEAIIAEFNGYQFMRIKFPNTYKSEVENFYLMFKSKLPNGLILSTQNQFSGTTDKLEIFMQNGSIYILLNFGRGNKKFKTLENCFDDKWHSIKMKRRRKNLKVWIDDNYYEFNNFLEMDMPIIGIKYLIIGSAFDNGTDIQDSSSKLVSNDIIHLGKVKRMENQFFMGYMMHFIYNGRNYFELAKKLSPLNIELTASLQPANVMRQFAINFHSTKSYLVIPKVNIFGDFRLEFQMKTLQPSGLLLFLQGESNDYLILEMVNGLLHIIYNWGSGYKRKISESGLLNDGLWHSVKIVRHMSKTHSFAFRVDGKPDDSRADVPVNTGGLNFNHFGKMHLGGYLENQSIVTFDNETPRSKGGFQGCIASFYVNNSVSTDTVILYKDLLKEANEKHYVDENCPDNHNDKENYCSIDSCSFGGKCTQHWMKYSCDCSSTSFSGPKCEDVSTTAQFVKHPSYLVYKYSIIKKHSINQLAFGFQTNTRKFAPLISIIGTQSLSPLLTIEIKIVNDYGFIQVEYYTNTGTHSFMESRLNVIDGLYHIVRFRKDRMAATLKLDDLSDRIHVPDGIDQNTVVDEELMAIVGSSEVSSKNSFQGFISGLTINEIAILDTLKENFNSYILLINKSNVDLVPNFQPRRSDQSLKQSEEEPKNPETNQKNNRIVVARPQCPGITEAEKFQCQQYHYKGIVKPGVAFKKPNTQEKHSKTNFEEFASRSTNKPFEYLLPNNDQTTSDFNINNMKINPKNENTIKSNLNINIWLIAAFSCGGAFMLIALSCLIYRCSTKDEGSYNVKEDRICIQTNLNSSKLKSKLNCDEKSNQSLLTKIPNKRKSKRKRSGETKEWYV